MIKLFQPQEKVRRTLFADEEAGQAEAVEPMDVAADLTATLQMEDQEAEAFGDVQPEQLESPAHSADAEDRVSPQVRWISTPTSKSLACNSN